MHLTQLSKKETKKVLKQFQEQFGIKSLDLDYLFFKNNDNKIFITSKEFQIIPQDKFWINNLGLYIAKIEKFGMHLTIEGSQLIGKKATKNVLDTNDYKEWMKGNDITTNKKFKGCIIIKNRDNYYGSGIYKNNRILNFIPKSRRFRS